MATSKLQVYAPRAASVQPRRDPDTSIYVSLVHVRVHTREGDRYTACFTRACVRAYIRAYVRARAHLDPLECRPANARVHAPGAIPAMRNVSSRTSTRVRKNGRLVSFFFFPCLPRAITRAGIKEPLIDFFSGPAQMHAHV